MRYSRGLQRLLRFNARDLRNLRLFSFTPALLAVILVSLPLPQTAQDETAGMALIPAGEFWMGRAHMWLRDELGWTERPRLDDRPVHRVLLDAYYIDKYEVTNKDYAQFTQATGHGKPYHWPGGNIPAGKENHPVYNVNWDDAQAYCRFVGKRLPTEAEWENAARGGQDRKLYPWGDQFDNAAAAGQDDGRVRKRAHTGLPNGPADVGSYPPNDLGLYDVIGNVWEWVEDWHDQTYYSISEVRNPRGPKTGVYRVIRGGGWSDTDERNITVQYRNYTDPATLAATVGFRCAKPGQN